MRYLSEPITLRSLPEMMAAPERDIPWLQEALLNAIRLELATMPPYLCALWSIEKGASEPAYQAIRSVLIEEMLHMAIACNLLTAIGGTPVIANPTIVPLYPGPLPGNVRPGLTVRLGRLSKPLLREVLMEIEFPQNGPVLLEDDAEMFPTVADFYNAILDAFEKNAPTLDTTRQLTVNFFSIDPLRPITTLAEVREKILLIKDQGEGSEGTPFEVPDNPELLGHYYEFAQIEAERRLVTNPDGTFSLTGDPLPFPATLPMADVPAGGFTSEETFEFDRRYSEMLVQLESAWRETSEGALNDAVSLMFTLEEEARRLMRIPVQPGAAETLGPCFRFVAPTGQETFTYRGGEKLTIRKEPDQFVVRALPETLAATGEFPPAEKVSSASSRITVAASELDPLMDQARTLAPTHHAYTVAETGEEFLITDRILVRFAEAPSPQTLSDFVNRYALQQQAQYSDRDFLFQLTAQTGMNPVKLVVQLNENEPLVESADHDLNIRASLYSLPPAFVSPPTDSAYTAQWHLHTRLAQDASYDRRSSARCEQAWEFLRSFGSRDVVIGITDDGCRLDHSDFNGAGKFAGWGYMNGPTLIRHIDPDADPARMYQTGSNHGTSCAGVAAAELDGVLSVGAAPGCRLLPIKWESEGRSLLISDSKLLRVLEFVASRADILSNSWGAPAVNSWSIQVRDRIRQLAESGGRRGKGMVFLWAAGNENSPIAHTANRLVPFTNGWQIRPSGDRVWVGVQQTRRFHNDLVGIPGVLHVAAISSTAQRSHYSNYGTGISLCAPSSNSHEYLRLAVRGRGIMTATGAGAGTGTLTSGFGGTSSATPLVAGIAALVLSANSSLSAVQVLSILKRTASKDLNLTGYDRTPSAPFDPDTSWDVSPVAPFDLGAFQNINDPDGTWSPWFGHGRIDARTAVEEATRLLEIAVTAALGEGAESNNGAADPRTMVRTFLLSETHIDGAAYSREASGQ